jgi:hypothetical protein
VIQNGYPKILENNIQTIMAPSGMKCRMALIKTDVVEEIVADINRLIRIG